MHINKTDGKKETVEQFIIFPIIIYIFHYYPFPFMMRGQIPVALLL